MGGLAELTGGPIQVAIQVVSHRPPYSALSRLSRAGSDGLLRQVVHSSAALLMLV